MQPEMIKTKINENSIFQTAPIAAAYLYGSQANGTAGVFSEIDIALLADKCLPPAAYLNVELELQAELGRLLGSERVEVRIINQAPLAFKGQVAMEGILLYSRDETARVDFEAGTRLQYMDFYPTLKYLQAAYLEQVGKEGLRGQSQQG